MKKIGKILAAAVLLVLFIGGLGFAGPKGYFLARLAQQNTIKSSMSQYLNTLQKNSNNSANPANGFYLKK